MDSTVQEDDDDSLGMFWFIMLGLAALISLFAVLGWTRTRTAGRVAQATVQMIAYQVAITNFNAVIGRWPHSLNELETNATKTVFVLAPPGAKDPWGRPYVYVPFNSATGFGRVISLGRDGKPGGTGLDADIERRFP